MAYLPVGLLFLIALFCGATVLSFVIAIRANREHRNTIFPVVREVEEGKARRARVAFVIFSVLSAISAGAWVATQQHPENIITASTTVEPVGAANDSFAGGSTSSSLAEVNAAVTITVAPPEPPRQEESGSGVKLAQSTPTSPSSIVVAPTSTPLPTATNSPVPADQSAPASSRAETAASALAATPTSPAIFQPAPAGAQIGPIVFATEITNRREAVNPAENFNTRARRIYAVFPYEGMRNGLPFSVVWFYQGQEVLRDESEWQWGSTDNSYTFITPRGAGDYKVELKIGSETLASGSFEVLP